MSSEWREVRLGDVATTLNGAGIKQEFFAVEGIPLARVSNFASGTIDLSDCIFVDRQHAQRWGSHRINFGDVIVATVGSWPPNWSSVVGKVVRAPVSAVGALQNQNTCRVDAREGLTDQRFLYYLLSTQDFVLFAANAATGSANQARLGVSSLEKFSFFLPSLAEQQEIGEFLGALDDRITLLRETNATLEAIAQALFKSWFVDFDPVRANIAAKSAPEGAAQGSTSTAQGTTAGMPEAGQRRKPLPPMPAAALDAATAALFPDSFEESELGLVPKGWRVGSLSDVCTIASGKRPPDRSDNSTEVCSIPLYGGAGLMGYTSASLFDETLIVTGRVGTLGKVHIAYPPFWASDNVLVVSPKSPSAFSFALNWIRSIDVQALNRGSTQPLLTQRDLGAQQGMIPSREVLHKFEEIVGRLYERIRSQEQQAQTLTQLRDTLLPRLISGQLRLPDVEAALRNTDVS